MPCQYEHVCKLFDVTLLMRCHLMYSQQNSISATQYQLHLLAGASIGAACTGADTQAAIAAGQAIVTHTCVSYVCF